MSNSNDPRVMMARAGTRANEASEKVTQETQRAEDLTAKERREYEERTKGASYGPNTLIGRSGRVFNTVPGRQPGTFNGFVNQTLTEERLAYLNAPPSSPKAPPERTTGEGPRGGRRGRGGGGGSTTLLTADGLISTQAGQRRTVLGA